MRTILLFTLSLIFGPLSQADDGARHVNATEAARLLKENDVTVLDVRTAGEFAAGHIAGATNIDFNGADFAARLEALDKAKPYLVHCQGGGRSGRSLAVFKKLGFTNIHHLDGGLSAWEDAKLPLEKK